MRLVIGKKPPPSQRDNQGKIIHAGTLMVSPDFPESWVPSRLTLEMTMEKVKLQVIKYYELKNHVIWKKP
jgi:hypothetical protein